VLGQTADLVLAYCRVHYMQIYPQFNRFTCKIFLQEGVQYFGGAAEQCMVDNTSVIRATGTGANMVPAPEMAAFGQRFGFKFVAHEVGHADRSAYVERFFDYVENNFLAGRKFADWDDVNRQARLWCDKNNSTFKRALHATPFELLAAERPRLKALPVYSRVSLPPSHISNSAAARLVRAIVFPRRTTLALQSAPTRMR
jgi:hypothetical protein